MTKRKDSKPARLCWFRLDVDAFFEDSRTQSLTTREKSFWLMMITRSFRQGGSIICDVDIISDNTGATEKEADKLLIKLASSGLLVSVNSHDTINMVSPRMVKEHQKAVTSYALKAEAGKEGGDAKARKYNKNI